MERGQQNEEKDIDCGDCNRNTGRNCGTGKAEETVPEEAVECLTEMPYEALPEEEFEFDEASRTITAYIGTSVDVIIPRTIGGVPVENISYNAFECARDYVHSDMATNQKERRVAANALSDSAGDIEVYRGQCFYPLP